MSRSSFGTRMKAAQAELRDLQYVTVVNALNGRGWSRLQCWFSTPESPHTGVLRAKSTPD